MVVRLSTEQRLETGGDAMIALEIGGETGRYVVGIEVFISKEAVQYRAGQSDIFSAVRQRYSKEK